MVGLSFAERLTQGGLGTVIGVGTVFLILIILWGVLELFRVIFYRPEKKAPVQEVKEEKVTSTKDETEVIAAITAAVAMMMRTAPNKFKIMSYKRVGSNFKR